jgi:hypothetical protein
MLGIDSWAPLKVYKYGFRMFPHIWGGGGECGNWGETVTVFVCEKVNYSYYRLHIFCKQFLFRVCAQSRINFIL